MPLESLQGKSESSLIDLALQELEKAGFPDALKQLVRLSPPGKMQQRPYYIHRAFWILYKFLTRLTSIQHFPKL
ncbi:hypothetical protein KBT16_07260 [Nostoc sp. CCCryo 231-06]|nr:hypothetical protein [Nostoc sp. CCCryo 231-06]